MAGSIGFLDFDGQENLAHGRTGHLYSATMQVAQWVKDARKAGKLTLEQLGEKLGVTKSNVWGWENEKHEPSIGQWLRIAEITGYPPVPHLIDSATLPADILQMAARLAQVTDAKTRELILLSAKAQVDLALERQARAAAAAPNDTNPAHDRGL
jgi:transcriptional regulator with XRE-family HTH domain